MKISTIILVSLLLVIPCIADIIVVEDDGSGDYPTIQAAIDAASTWDIIEVQPGTYIGNGNRDIDFRGKAITVRSIDPNNPDIVAATIIDCNGTESTPYRGFSFHHNEDANSILAGLTITNGYATRGGAIYCYYASPTITHCNITGNTAYFFGASDGGGGIYCLVSSSIITNCKFSDNTAKGFKDSGGDGGGIRCSDTLPSPTISNCVFSGNSAGDQGGGVYNCDGPITDCIVINNSSFSGAGLNTCNGPITNCIISGNSAPLAGGLDWCLGPISNCIITGNCATIWDGGGLGWCHTMITNCIIADNSSARRGGGIYGSSATVINCVIFGNSAGVIGGGIYLQDYEQMTMTNCIIWNNEATLGAQIALARDTPEISLSYCDVEGGELAVYNNGFLLNWGIGNIDVDPCFAPTGDYSIRSNSPCIDSGTNTPTGGLPLTDMDGHPRIADGDGDGISKADIGACEFTPVPLIGYSPENFEFQMLEGDVNPSNQILSIANIRDGILNWNITKDCSWLQICPDHGISEGDTNEITLTVDGSCLGGGTYNCVLEISDPCAVNNPQKVDIKLVVKGPEIGLSNNNFKFFAGDGIEHVNSQTLNIHNSGGGTLHWSISYDCNWLTIEPNEGISTGEINGVALSVDRNAISKGDYYTCEVFVSDPNAKKSTEKIKIEFDYISGDFEPDGDVDLNDLAFFITYWLTTDCDETEWCHGADLDESGNVDFKDFAKLAGDWLK